MWLPLLTPSNLNRDDHTKDAGKPASFEVFTKEQDTYNYITAR